MSEKFSLIFYIMGIVGIGRITKGCIKNGQEVAICKKDGTIQKLRIGKLYTYSGLKRIETEVAHCGDIVAVNGVIGINIGETIADPENPVAVPFVDIDEPTFSKHKKDQLFSLDLVQKYIKV